MHGDHRVGDAPYPYKIKKSDTFDAEIADILYILREGE